MKRFFILLISIVFILIACGSGSTFRDDAIPLADTAKCNPKVHFTADSSFTDEERAEIMAAMDEWYEFSHGRIQFSVEFTDARHDNHHIFKMSTTDPYMVAADSAIQAKYNLPSNWHYAGLSDGDHRIELSMDWIAAGKFQSVMTHELGHQAGLFIRYCNLERTRDCVHSWHSGALMCGFPESTECTGSDHLNELDRQFCQASCQCD